MKTSRRDFEDIEAKEMREVEKRRELQKAANLRSSVMDDPADALAPPPAAG